jgi:NAD+ kinase
MKYRIYLHRSRPKVSAKDIAKIFKGIGINPTSKDPDIAIIVGGDGTFGYFGRKLEIPMLFVGVKDSDPVGSKASLAELFFDKLHYGIRKIEEGNYYIENRTLMSVDYCGRHEDVFTDVYLERGNFGGCLRYLVSFNTKKGKHNGFRFTDYAIGNGVIVCTATGSSGYFSYPQRIISEATPNYEAQFSNNELGICHITPYSLLRVNKEQTFSKYKKTKVQFTIPLQSEIRLNLLRPSNAILYGVSRDSRGVKICEDDTISIKPSPRMAKVIKIKG